VPNYYLLTHRDLQRTPRVRAFSDFPATEIKAFRTMLSGQAEWQKSDTKSSTRVQRTDTAQE